MTGSWATLNLSHLYTIKKNSCNLFYNKGTVVLLNRALGVHWAQKGRVSFNLYSDYLLSYQIPSECEVKQTASLTHAACHHLHAASWFIPWQRDVGTVRLRRTLQDAWHWSPGRGRHVEKHLSTYTASTPTACTYSDLVTFIQVQCVRAHTSAHTQPACQ